MRVRLVLLASIVLALFAARNLAPPRPSASGAFGRGPTIVLVHGLGSRADHWLPVARLLARRHRVRLVDLPGHGQSEMPAPFSLARATEALNAALALEENNPVVLVGHSLGGLVATAATLQHPEQVRALVLVETALKPQLEGADRDAALQALDHDYQGLLREAYGAFGRDSIQGAALYADVARMDPAVIKPWIRLALNTDLSQDVARLDVPLLVVLAPRSWPHGEAWPITAKALGYERIPQLRTMRIDGCGHFVMLDCPAELAEAIERFADAPQGMQFAAR
jgi:pimeloyl-ACP methyl ester carboxylesterase